MLCVRCEGVLGDRYYERAEEILTGGPSNANTDFTMQM